MGTDTTREEPSLPIPSSPDPHNEGLDTPIPRAIVATTEDADAAKSYDDQVNERRLAAAKWLFSGAAFTMLLILGTLVLAGLKIISADLLPACLASLAILAGFLVRSARQDMVPYQVAIKDNFSNGPVGALSQVVKAVSAARPDKGN